MENTFPETTETPVQPFSSKLIEELNTTVSTEDTKTALRKLLAPIGENEEDTIASLASEPIRLGALKEIELWTSRIADQAAMDDLGKAATRFWVAQTLVTTVLLPRVLHQDVADNQVVKRIMVSGAEGVFAVGKEQFKALANLIAEFVHWLEGQSFGKIAILESPLGNSLPVQILCAYATRKGLDVTPLLWNAPRNDRASVGATVQTSAHDFAKDASDFDVIIYFDDAISGTRLLKMFDALRPELGDSRFIPVAMIFDQPDAPNSSENRARLRNRMDKLAERTNRPLWYRQFPVLPEFRQDNKGLVRWESPVIWGESDLIAGKRKVNLVFTLLDHIFSILAGLVADTGRFRPYLEMAWSKDTSGQTYCFSPGLLSGVFSKANNAIARDNIHSHLRNAARTEFPSDYDGTITDFDIGKVKVRWDWLRDSFLSARPIDIDEDFWNMVWHAVDNVFVGSFTNETPRARRDEDATPYTLPFNANVQALNLRLSELVLCLAKRC